MARGRSTKSFRRQTSRVRLQTKNSLSLQHLGIVVPAVDVEDVERAERPPRTLQ